MIPHPLRIALRISHRKEFNMAEKSRIRLNHSTKEIEIEGTEKFVKKYFDIVHEMILVSRGPKPVEKTSRPEKAGKRPVETGRKNSNTSAVLSAIRESKKGITTAELKAKTGLSDRQIWAIADKAKREGKIKKTGRGMYIAS